MTAESARELIEKISLALESGEAVHQKIFYQVIRDCGGDPDQTRTGDLCLDRAVC